MFAEPLVRASASRCERQPRVRDAKQAHVIANVAKRGETI